MFDQHPADITAKRDDFKLPFFCGLKTRQHELLGDPSAPKSLRHLGMGENHSIAIEVIFSEGRLPAERDFETAPALVVHDQKGL